MVRLTINLIAIFVVATTTMATEVVLVADPWPPFNMEVGSEQEGYIVDVARIVFEAAGHTVVYKNVPWKRAVSGTRSVKYTGAIGASKTDGEGLVFPDEELARNLLNFYVLKDSPWKFEGLSSIEAVAIGVIGGYDYRDWLNEYIRTHSGNDDRVQVLSAHDPLKQNLNKLLYRRIDVVVDTEAAIRYKANKLGILDKIKPAGCGEEPAYIYIAFSPNRPESPMLARQLSDGIRGLRQNGQLKKILDSYGLLDWK
ncbi:amino acid ABC transporter substrate-binding protein [Desulfosarcina widdelii]|uniref:Amino acid ABC transporter substrate-binding protein n=1 Tax=Desulfosarcina widdelii TaxID=947919 RepID=A0A5K7Z8E6_9BACT|nr:transporter substrate-binding domain-containing protein [Desulfosarcina widdelii]BBO76965.1 amino acid ABC transporter substrate-binding protein [Desulfosarcina widdelii]